MMRGWGIIIDRKILLDKSPPPGDTGKNRGVKDMIDVEKLRDTLSQVNRHFVVSKEELAELLDRLEAAERDANRLDWLEQQARQSRTGISFDWIPTCEGEPSGFRFMRRHFIGQQAKTLRKAIDRVMGGSDEQRN